MRSIISSRAAKEHAVIVVREWFSPKSVWPSGEERSKQCLYNSAKMVCLGSGCRSARDWRRLFVTTLSAQNTFRSLQIVTSLTIFSNFKSCSSSLKFRLEPSVKHLVFSDIFSVVKVKRRCLFIHTSLLLKRCVKWGHHSFNVFTKFIANIFYINRVSFGKLLILSIIFDLRMWLFKKNAVDNELWSKLKILPFPAFFVVRDFPIKPLVKAENDAVS